MNEYATIHKEDLELLEELLQHDPYLAGEVSIAILEHAFNVPEEERLIQNPLINAYIKQKRACLFLVWVQAGSVEEPG